MEDGVYGYRWGNSEEDWNLLYDVSDGTLALMDIYREGGGMVYTLLSLQPVDGLLEYYYCLDLRGEIDEGEGYIDPATFTGAGSVAFDYFAGEGRSDNESLCSLMLEASVMAL